MFELPHYVNETYANALNNVLFATDRSCAIAITVRNIDNQSRKLSETYPEGKNYLLEKFATYHAIAEFDNAMLQYMQFSDLAPLHYAGKLLVKSCKVANVSDGDTLKDVSIEGLLPSNSHYLRQH